MNHFSLIANGAIRTKRLAVVFIMSVSILLASFAVSPARFNPGALQQLCLGNTQLHIQSHIQPAHGSQGCPPLCICSLCPQASRSSKSSYATTSTHDAQIEPTDTTLGAKLHGHRCPSSRDDQVAPPLSVGLLIRLLSRSALLGPLRSLIALDLRLTGESDKVTQYSAKPEPISPQENLGRLAAWIPACGVRLR